LPTYTRENDGTRTTVEKERERAARGTSCGGRVGCGRDGGASALAGARRARTRQPERKKEREREEESAVQIEAKEDEVKGGYCHGGQR